MRVFVLSPGRSGSKTFAEACAHLTNFTVDHEARSGRTGDARFDYPDQHISVDNRLTWLTGGLAARERPEDRYVWLRRDRDDVTASFLRRWRYSYRAGIIEAFAHAIVQHAEDWPDEDREAVARFYVESVEDNIADFLRDRESMTVWAGSSTDFDRFLGWIGAEGDLRAAAAEWSVRHNASV